MGKELTIVFFLWRHHSMSQDAFVEYYNEHHLNLVSTSVSPPPRFHERSFPLRDRPFAGTSSFSRLLSFDSFVAVTFDDEEIYRHWGTILAGTEIGAAINNDEAVFTEADRRVNFFAETERSLYPGINDADDLTHVLRLVKGRRGMSRTEFKSVHEAMIAECEVAAGQLSRTRYYTVPDHPLSMARRAWDSDIGTALNLIEHITFCDAETAIEGAMAIKEAASHRGIVSVDEIIDVGQVSRLPAGWMPEDMSRS